MLRGLPAQGGFEAAYYGTHLLAAGVSIMPWANVWRRHVVMPSGLQHVMCQMVFLHSDVGLFRCNQCMHAA